MKQVKEETGLDITDLTFYKDQPWGFSSSLIFTYVAKAHGNQKITLEDHELKIAQWVTRNDTYVDPKDDASITSEMIHKYLEGEL